MVLNLSCPAVSHYRITLTHYDLHFHGLVLEAGYFVFEIDSDGVIEVLVELVFLENKRRGGTVYLVMMQDLPTPLFPMIRSLMRYSLET